jgi:hypothetical protein
MSFVRRILNFTFRLSQGAFSGSDNQVDLSGLRSSVKIVQAGGAGYGTADIQIWGMTLDVMNKLSTLGFVPENVKQNVVSVQAGNEGEGVPATVFQGTITAAWVDAQQAPSVSFRVTANNGLLEAVIPAAPSSYTEGTSAEQILSGLATQMGLRFENNGVKTKFSYTYYYGSPLVQAQKVVDAAGIEWNGTADGILAIWPKGGSRGLSAVDIGPETGMVGYPSYTPYGIMFQSLYNPNLTLGGKIKLTSSILPEQTVATPSGIWVVYSLDHDLECQMPRGKWFSTVMAAPEGYALPPT